jgi:hypothetical protein
MEKLNLRASALPLAFRCPGSIRPSAIPMNAANDAASDGTAAHEVLSALPSTGIRWEAVGDIAGKHGANAKEVRMLSALGAKLWNQVSDSFVGALTEVDLKVELLPGVFLTGHADLLAVSQTSMRVGDWKTGRKDYDHSHQFRAYAAMAMLSSEDIQVATGTGLWVREQEIENYTLTRQEALAWKRRLLDEVVNWDGVFHPSQHCALYCPRSHECAAANALARRDVAAIADKALVARVESELSLMTPDEIVEVLHKADLVEKYAKRVRDAVRSHVSRNGDVVAGDVRLTVVEEPRRELDTQAAWGVLEKLGFQDAEFARVVRLSVSAIEEVIQERAPRGKKKAAVETLKALLEESGAVQTHTIEKLKEKRA